MEKLKIFICEDNDKQRDGVELIINEVIFNENFNMEIALATSDPYKIIQYVKSNQIMCAYFLDVNLNNNITGIELAKEIRKYDPNGYIVFITEKNELAYLTFKYRINAIDYIEKDCIGGIKNNIFECMKNINDDLRTIKTKNNQTFCVEIGGRYNYVKYKDILFFETSKTIHKIVLHTINKSIEFYGQLKDIENNLDNRFYRCHKSFIVNKENVKQVKLKEKEIEMIDGSSCLVSRRLINKLKE